MSAELLAALRSTHDTFTAPGGPFEMEEIEVRGIPMRVFKSAPPTMRALWELATLHGDKPYIVYEDEHYTYAEIAGQVRRLAAVLAGDHGVGAGDRVALAMRNYPEWVIGYWATVVLGAAVVGINAWWTTAEMEFALRDSQPLVIIADDERLERLLPVLDDLRADAPLAVLGVRTTRELPSGARVWDDVVTTTADPGVLPAVDIDPDDDVTIFYTSGTTGAPKGAQLTHRGSVTNVMNLAYWNVAAAAAQGAVAAAGGGTAPPDAPPSHTYLAPTPLFHVTACNCMLHPMTLTGGTVVLMRRWDPARAIELIERERVTGLSGVPSMTRDLLLHPDWQTRDTSSLVSMGGGGAPVPPDLVAKVGASLSRSRGVPVIGYGLTETHGIVTANGAAFALAKPESCGPAVPTADIKIVADDGTEIAPGGEQAGELCVRGSIVIKGYLNRPDATADAIVDGWFHTGDIARIDEDGFVYIVDRAKDMVLRGGENVYCAEVENAIYQHPSVHEAVVFGIAEERLGEEVAAAVVPVEGADLAQDDLVAFLAERIAKYKIPTTWWFRTEPLPRNANGKFLKRALRDELVATGSRTSG